MICRAIAVSCCNRLLRTTSPITCRHKGFYMHVNYPSLYMLVQQYMYIKSIKNECGSTWWLHEYSITLIILLQHWKFFLMATKALYFLHYIIILCSQQHTLFVNYTSSVEITLSIVGLLSVLPEMHCWIRPINVDSTVSVGPFDIVQICWVGLFIRKFSRANFVSQDCLRSCIKHISNTNSIAV